MKHYIYQITNNINGKFYRGIHTTNNIDDGYMGSGSNMKYALKKYGKDAFTKTILCYAESRADALELESLAVTQEDVDNPKCYNLVPGGCVPPVLKGKDNHNYGKPLPSEVRKKISETKIGTVATNRKSGSCRLSHYTKSGEERWAANIGVNGKHKHLGYFKTEQEARAARVAAEERYW